MGKIQDDAKKLLKAMYDDWLISPNTYPKADLKVKFAGIFQDPKDYVRARMYLVSKKLITRRDIDPSYDKFEFEMNAMGIDFIENGQN